MVDVERIIKHWGSFSNAQLDGISRSQLEKVLSVSIARSRDLATQLATAELDNPHAEKDSEALADEGGE